MAQEFVCEMCGTKTEEIYGCDNCARLVCNECLAATPDDAEGTICEECF